MQQEQLNVLFFFPKSDFAFQADGGKYLQRRRGKHPRFVYLSCRKTLLAAAASLLCVLQGDSRG